MRSSELDPIYRHYFVALTQGLPQGTEFLARPNAFERI
jgi:hypothetical protein